MKAVNSIWMVIKKSINNKKNHWHIVYYMIDYIIIKSIYLIICLKMGNCQNPK
jgi:hypothetical protein